MSIQIAQNLSEKKWNDFIKNHSEGNIFHTPEMFKVFQRTKDYQPQIWIAVENGHVLALLIPVQIALTNGLFRRFCIRNVVYGSILCVPGEKGQEALTFLIKAYKNEVANAPIFTEFRNITNLNSSKLNLQKQGFVYQPFLNYLVYLNQSEDAIMQNIGRRTRKHIRRELRRRKVFIEEVKNRNQIDLCYDLLNQSYQKARIPLADISLFEAAFELLRPKNMIRFTLAKVGQTPVAVSIDLLYKDIVYGWYGGMDRRYSSYMANYLLMWKIFQWAAANKYRLYDFGGAGRPEKKYGVRDFKAKFGGKLVCFGRNTYVHAPVKLAISKVGYQIYRKIWLNGSYLLHNQSGKGKREKQASETSLSHIFRNTVT